MFVLVSVTQATYSLLIPLLIPLPIPLLAPFLIQPLTIPFPVSSTILLPTSKLFAIYDLVS